MNNIFLLFMNLLEERNRIRDGWLPDYADKEQIKYSVNQWHGTRIAIAKFSEVFDMFTFETYEQAEEFYDNNLDELQIYFDSVL